MSRITNGVVAVEVGMTGSSASLLPLGSAFHDLEHPRHPRPVDARTVDRRVMRLVRGHVDTLRRVGGGHLLIVERAALLPQVAQVRLKPVHALLDQKVSAADAA